MLKPQAMAATLCFAALTIFSGMSAAEDEAPPPRDLSPARSRVGVSLDMVLLGGPGLSVGIPLGDMFNIRAAGNYFSLSRDFDSDQATYKGKIKLFTAGILADWHPFHGVFRMTAGALHNGNSIKLDAQPSGGTIDVGDCKYTSDPADPLNVHGQTNFRSFAPYFGLGWGGNLNDKPGFFGTFDLGVMFSGAAGVTIHGSGTAHNNDPAGHPECGSADIDASSDPDFQKEIDKDQKKINDDVDKVKVWPMIGFGVGWRF